MTDKIRDAFEKKYGQLHIVENAHDKFNAFFAGYQAALSSLEQVGYGKFIPCSERMPINGQFFLAFGKNIGAHVDGPNMEICRWNDRLLVEGGTELAYPNQTFSHWIPLPEEPKGE